MNADPTWQPNLREMPLSVHLVGNGPEPVIYSVWDRKPDDGNWTFADMTIVSRAALRALLNEAIAMIDRQETQ